MLGTPWIVFGIGMIGAVSAVTATDSDKMLNSYMTLSLSAAKQAAQAALDRCQKDGFTVAVALVERAGHPTSDAAGPLGGSAYAANSCQQGCHGGQLSHGYDRTCGDAQPGKAASGVRHLSNVVAVGGGLVIRAKGSIVGGIGVSGAPGGDADDVCAKAGIAAIYDAIERE